MPNYEEMMQEVDRRISAIDMNGCDIINDCRMIIVFLKEKLSVLKTTVESCSFNNDADEITFFKHYKPIVLGRLIYFHRLLHIESQRPLCEDTLDEYYLKRQEELKLFFDRHVAFYQYYKSGGNHLDEYCFLRRQQNKEFDVHVYHFDENSEFSTGYDHLVARIIAVEMLHAYLAARRHAVQRQDCEKMSPELLKMNGKYKWTGNAIELVELVYGLNEMQSINSGDVPIQELVTFIATTFSIDVKDCYSAYTDMKRRKNSSRTYFTDKMRERLNQRMAQDDERERAKR